MEKVSYLSVWLWSIGSAVMLYYTAFGFYKCLSMWILSISFTGYSILYLCAYYYQKRNTTKKLRLFQKLRLAMTIFILGMFVGITSIVI